MLSLNYKLTWCGYHFDSFAILCHRFPHSCNTYRITTVLKAETDIINSIAVSPINIIMWCHTVSESLSWYWQYHSVRSKSHCIRVIKLILTISLCEIKGKMSKLPKKYTTYDRQYSTVVQYPYSTALYYNCKRLRTHCNCVLCIYFNVIRTFWFNNRY